MKELDPSLLETIHEQHKAVGGKTELPPISRLETEIRVNHVPRLRRTDAQEVVLPIRENG